MLSTRSKAGRTSLSSWSCILPPNKGPMSGGAEHQMSRGSQRHRRDVFHLQYYTRCLVLCSASRDVAQPRLPWQEAARTKQDLGTWGILSKSLTRPSYVTNLLWKHVRGGTNSDAQHKQHMCDQERGSGVGCGHHHRRQAGPLTVQVVDDFVPGGGVLG